MYAGNEAEQFGGCHCLLVTSPPNAAPQQRFRCGSYIGFQRHAFVFEGS
jgi:hypothetical protein